MGLFSKIKAGLQKTKSSMMGAVEGVLSSFTKIDDDLFDELEEILIMSDVGVVTSTKICEILRQRVKSERVTDPAKIKGMLKEIISDMLSGGERLNINTKPSVILVIGVNGVGKTTTIGKMAALFKAQDKKDVYKRQALFRSCSGIRRSKYGGFGSVHEPSRPYRRGY